MENIILKYHQKDYTFIEILSALALKHGIVISKSTLVRRLKSMNLRKYKIQSPIEEIIGKIFDELEQSDQLLGYKSLWYRLKITHHLKVKRETVQMLIKQIDPEGVAQRTARKFKRRQYFVPGPNHLWHLDGYDKLKPYGFPIHCCIDGFSRYIIWLKVSTSNNNPKHIAKLYLDALKSHEIMPKIIRTDRGTENSLLSGIQPSLRALHTDNLSGIKSFMYGRSTANQRIEAYWGQLRKKMAQYWMEFFKNMMNEGILDNTNTLHIDCLRFCFMEIIQKELDSNTNEWNLHYIRKQKNSENPYGKPEIMFKFPELYNTLNCGKEIDSEEIDLYSKIYCDGIQNAICNPLFIDLVKLILPDILKPDNVEQAKALFKMIIEIINIYID